MARRGSPALYELLGRGRESKPTPVIPVNIPPRPQGRSGRGGVAIGAGGTKASSVTPASTATGSPNAGLSGPGKPGLSIDPQVAKFVGFALAAGIVLLGVYWLGVARGTSNAAGGGLTADQSLAAAGSGSASVVPSGSSSTTGGSAPDQVASSNAAGGGADRRSTQSPATQTSGGADAAAASSNAAARAPAVPAAAPRLAPAATSTELGPPLPPAQRGIDPRQAGLNYFVIASVAEANADKLVAFCRERALDAWVVPDHNGRLREITVLPGIPSSEKKGAVAKALEERIRKVGQQWQAAGRGNSDFNDRYLKLFNG